jgi:hypothetical protein
MTPSYTDRLVIRQPSQEDPDDFLAYRNADENMRLQPIKHIHHAEALTFWRNRLSLPLMLTIAGLCLR